VKTFDLIEMAAQKIRLALLTNATTKLDSDLELLGIKKAFKFVFNSSTVGLFKPDPKLFLYVLDQVGCEASEILFIDDSISHIQSARELGFTSHHYEGIEGLSKFFKDQGLV
jgi:HAD superfamily hydrolase (TIGR01509 family)